VLFRSLRELEIRPVRVNGQPGRLLIGPDEEPYGEAERLAVEEALAALKSADPKELAAHVARDTDPIGAPGDAVHIWSVLTVDVVDGRIQTVRIVRNPDKLAHL